VEINSNSLQVDDNGRITFSGLGSGIDFEAAVDGIISARRIPVDRLEANVEANALKITAFQDLRSILNSLQDGIADLRGAASFDGTASIFNAKQAFASVSRTDGTTPSSAGNLIGVTVTNAANAESHEIELLQTARAHKIASDSVSSTSADLGLTENDQFDIEGTTITVSDQDTLLTLRDRINAANTGTNATGVSASIVTVSSTQHYLVLSKDEAGSDITISDTTGTPLQSIGVLTGGGAPNNVLQTARYAEFYADGLLDSTNTTYESVRQDSSAATLGFDGTIRFDDGSTTLDLAYTSGQSISTLASNINGDVTLQGMGISASIVTEGDEVRLKIVTTGDAFTMTEQAAGTVLTDLGIDNSRQLISRTSNTVSDLFTGVTLSLFQAEVGTNIRIDIEQDLSAVKTQIGTFVDAYNAAKVYINTQTAIDETTGAVSEDAILYGSRTLANIESQLKQIIGIGTEGVDESFSVLAQIGIEFVDNGSLSDPLEADTLTIDESVLDSVLLSNPDEVRRLFSFDFSTSDPRVTLLSFNGNTDYSATGYTLNINYDDRYQSDAVTDAGAVTQVEAQTGGAASDGISAITFDDSVISGQAFRYSYDSVAENLTVENLTLGTSETVDITANLDAVAGTGLDLGAGETISVDFSTLGVTLTLSGTSGFLRGTDIADGTLDVSALDVNTTMTAGAVTTPTSGMDELTVDALVAAGAYNAATGLLTLGVTSTAGGEAHFDLATGIKFRVDGGSVLSDITAVDLDDGLSHTIDFYVTTTTPADVQVASLSFTSLASTLAGSGSLTIDLGTGLLGETSSVASATAPMENYLTSPALGSGSFNIRDSGSNIIGTFAYDPTDSLQDLADLINADADFTASIVDSGGTFRLEVTHVSNDSLTFTDDTDSLLAQLNMTDNGSSILSANIGGNADGSDDGSVTVSGNTITVLSTSDAEGLQILYTGNGDASGIQLDYTVGIGSQMYFALDDILDETTGAVENEIEALSDQNTFNETRIAEILARLERQRISLLERFIAMESALSSMNSLLDQIKETFNVLTQDR